MFTLAEGAHFRHTQIAAGRRNLQNPQREAAAFGQFQIAPRGAKLAELAFGQIAARGAKLAELGDFEKEGIRGLHF